jgi:hypothetical protein
MDRLTQIEERLANATPGPWERDQFGPDDDSARFIGSPSTGRIVVYEAATAGNAELIAHAPADLATLVKFAREIEGIHRPRKVICLNPSHGKDCDGQVCDTCDNPWPCPTAAAVQTLGEGS